LIVLIAAFGWLAISNHCVLGMVGSAKAIAAPPACHGVPHAPGKSNSDQAPCCKVLRATVELSKPPVAYDTSTFSLQADLAALIILADQLIFLRPLELDTGPPNYESFAESVLQRSILAHAPPFLA
jgi:hypothetical protein